MVNSKSIDNLLKKKKYKGEQLGRILLLTLVDQIYNRPPRVPIDQLSQMINNLANGYEGSVYNTYVNIYAELADAYNAIQASAVQARLGLTNIKLSLSVMTRAAISREMKLSSPVTITERQFRRYQTKYNKYIKEVADSFKDQENTVLEYLLSRLDYIIREIIEPFNEDADEGSNKEDYSSIEAVLEQYKHEDISPKWDAPIRNIYAKDAAKSNTIFKDRYQFVLNSIVTTTMHDEEVKDQLDNLHESTVDEVKKDLQAIYLNARFNDEKDEDAAAKVALDQVGLELEILDNMNKEPEKEALELPAPITKYDIFYYFIFNMANLYKQSKDNPKVQRIDADDAKLLNDFYKDQLVDMMKATSKDLIKDNPKLKDLISISDPDDLDRILTGKELAKAGDSFYKDMTSITTLKEEHDYGIWNVFPKKDQSRARQYGFSVFHSGDDFTQSGDDYFLQAQQAEDTTFMAELNNFTSESDQLDQNYEMVEKYFKEYQTYSKFIDGLVEFANSKELGDLKAIPGQYDVLDEIANIQTLRSLELSELKKVLSTTDYRKYAKRIKELYPIPDPDKKRIAESTDKQVASYIARIFSWQTDTSNQPVITSVLFDDIAEGNVDD